METGDKSYIIKNLTPWMIEELKAFSDCSNFTVHLLRKQKPFYRNEINQLEKQGIKVFEGVRTTKRILKKIYIVVKFALSNLMRFKGVYNLVIGLKSIYWFLLIDIDRFSNHSTLHSQFATQPSLVSVLIKEFYNENPRFAFTFHAHDIFFNNRWFKFFIEKCDVAFSISNYNLQYVKSKYVESDKIVLSRLGVSQPTQMRENTSKDNKKLTIGFLSWFVEKKGLFYLLDAICNLKDDMKIKVIIAGDGPEKEKFLTYMHENKLDLVIEYLGSVNGEEKTLFYNLIDVFILPSISLPNDKDGIPVVLMEAISYGLPIISTNVSGIPEICIDNFNGFLVNERSSMELENKIRELFKEPALIDKFKRNSVKLSKQEFDLKVNSNAKLKKLRWI